MDVETMELLDLFARVDYRAAWGTILKELGLSLYLPRVLDTAQVQGHGRLYPRFRIKQLAELFAELRRHFDRFTQRLVFAIKPTAHTLSFYAVRQAFVQCWADRHNGGNGATQPRKQSDRIPVAFDLDWSQVKERKIALAIMDRVLTMSTLREDPSRFAVFGRSNIPDYPKSTAFDLQWFLSHFSGSVVQDSTCQTIQAVNGRYGIPTRLVALSDTVNSIEKVSPVITTAFFRFMLLDQPRHKMPSEFHLGDGLCIHVFKAAISALQVNTSVRHLQLGGSGILGGSARAAWPWVAYSLFSAEAAHSIERLGLDLAFEDMNAFERVILAQDPLAAVSIVSEKSTLAPLAERLARQPSVVEIGPKTAMQYTMGSSLLETVTGEKPETLRVGENSPTSPFIRVVYPGAGICWVARDDVVAVRTVSVPTQNVTSIRRLDITIRGASTMPVLLRLLKLIGRSVTTLHVQCRAVSMIDESRLVDSSIRALF